MIQVPPVEQWLTELPFSTDPSYPRDFVMIMREAGTVVNLECLGMVPADHFVAISGTNYEVGSVDLDIAGAGGEGSCVDGEQYLTASAPVGVMVGGVDWATSYGYPGGLNFQSLWVPPTDPPRRGGPERNTAHRQISRTKPSWTKWRSVVATLMISRLRMMIIEVQSTRL
jgi:hypothetical protein